MFRLNHWLFTFSMLFFCTAAMSQYYELKPVENFGGKQQLRTFIDEELVYPEKALREKTEGKVVITCTVTRDGETRDVKVSQPVSPEIDAEALRIFDFLLWEPAVFRGTKLDDQVSVEVEFKIKKYQRVVKKRGYDAIVYPYEPVDQTMTIFDPDQLRTPLKPIYDRQDMRFSDFVRENLVYPPAALKQAISGTVELFFVVEPSGRSSNIKIVHGVGGGCNEEAIRLLKLIKWTPGIFEGKAVRTRMTLSLTFNLADYENMRYVPANNNNQF